MEKRVARCSECSKSEGPHPPSFGVMKPDIVFFGESLPNVFYNSLESDIPQVSTTFRWYHI
jgi:NAD-dependent SIR2 family protein deacetylase